MHSKRLALIRQLYYYLKKVLSEAAKKTASTLAGGLESGAGKMLAV
jgi:hypothetical protein